MKDRFPAFIALLMLCALVAGTWWAAGYTQRAVQVDPPARMTHDEDSWGSNFVMIRTDPQGMPINRLEGDYAKHFPDDGSYFITKPRAFGEQPGNPVTIGTSDTATMDKTGNTIVMIGHAHVHRFPDPTHKPLDVRSQQLTILSDSDVVYTHLPAQVQQGDSNMNGTGMRYDNKTQQLQVYSASNVEIANSDSHGLAGGSKPKPPGSGTAASSGTGKTATPAKPKTRSETTLP